MSDPSPVSPAGRPHGAAADTAAAAATPVVVEHRELLVALVSNLLGSVADTEDMLQVGGRGRPH